MDCSRATTASASRSARSPPPAAASATAALLRPVLPRRVEVVDRLVVAFRRVLAVSLGGALGQDRDLLEPTGFAITRQGKRRYGDAIVEKDDPRGRKYYWIGGTELDFEDEPGTDFAAINDGLVSVTPLHLDLTNYEAMRTLSSLRLDWP